MPSENQFFSMKEQHGFKVSLGYMVVPFLGGVTHLGGPAGHRKQSVHFSTHLRQPKGYSALTDLIKNQSIGGP